MTWYPIELMSQPMHPAVRLLLEREVQELVGPIVNVAELSNATLYGIRDRRRNFDAVRSFANPGRR